jgi:hypothetical protein
MKQSRAAAQRKLGFTVRIDGLFSGGLALLWMYFFSADIIRDLFSDLRLGDDLPYFFTQDKKV